MFPVRYDQFILGYALSLIVGLSCYFALNFEPNILQSAVMAMVTGLVWFICRRYLWARFLSGCLFFFISAFFIGSFRTGMQAAPVLKQGIENVVVSGIVEEASITMDTQHVIVGHVTIKGYPPEDTPKRVSLNMIYTFPELPVGASVQLTTSLYPPMLPAVNGSYEFARSYWFQQIGALGQIHSIDELIMPSVTSFHEKVERIRRKIADRLMQVLSFEQAQAAVPLVIGDQSIVSQELYDLYRYAGIAHILSVSGFHLSLLAGLIFFVIRFGLALFPIIALRYNTKKAAAFISLLVVTGYLFLSGAHIPAVRAYIMISLSLVAILFDRNPLSLNFVAFAALVMLICRPEFIINIGFQLSFMAVLALVCLFEKFIRPFKAKRIEEITLRHKIKMLIVSILIVDFLATLATTPFILYHFNQFATYGFLGNLMTGLLFSFFIMPLLLLGVVMMPFGFETPFFLMAGYLLDRVHELCHYIGDLPGAVLYTTSFPIWGLVAFTFGFIILFLSSGYWRGLSLIFIGLGCVSFVHPVRPDLLVFGADGPYVVGIRQNDQLHVIAPKSNDYHLTSATWMRRFGMNPDYLAFPKGEDLPAVITIQGKRIAFEKSFCKMADVSFVDVQDADVCGGLVISFPELKSFGTHALFIREDHIEIETAAMAGNNRPWGVSRVQLKPRSD